MNKKLHANFVKLVSLLNEGGYHDGTTIGEALHMTRSAVWKAIKKLEHYDIKLDTVKGKGYALLEPFVLLDSQKIKKNIMNRDIDLSLFERLDSTNAYLKTLPKSKAIRVCLAEQQTQGRGRFNREWYSPFAKNIYLSVLYPFQKDVSELSGLSLAMSLAVIKTLKQFGVDEKLLVKWPNDIVYDHQKISGSLIEIQAETHGACYAIIGIGINVNMLPDEGKSISQAWTSVQQILQKYIDRNLVCAALLNHMLDDLHRFETEGLLPFVEEWNETDYLMNKWISVTTLQESLEGKVQGINEQGHLLLKLKNGKLRALSSGDTSIVKK